MNIGDKVRLIHSKEEGIVVKFLKNDMVEVEIEAGFKLPILRKELAIVSKVENNIFHPSTKNIAVKEKEIPMKYPEIRADKGIFLAFLPINESKLQVYIINNSDWTLPFSCMLDNSQNFFGLIGGVLEPKSHQCADKELLLKDFDDWGVIIFECLFYHSSQFKYKSFLSKKMRLRANSFFNSKAIAPILSKECYLFQLDAEENTVKINPEELKNSMFSSNSQEMGMKIAKPASEIDLHIEKLVSNVSSLNNEEIITIQMSVFEKNLESAIATGMDEIIFIHGVGNGILKNLIHKRLSGHKNVGWFKDAQKEKFGFGATMVKIK